MNSHLFLTLAIAIALCSTSGIPCARAAEEKPALTEPDKSVVFPENLKKDGPSVQGESPNTIVERLKPDPLLGDMQYTYNQPSGVFIFRITRPHRPKPDLFVMVDGKPNKNGRYGNIQDFAKSLESLIQIINKEHTSLDYLSVNLLAIDEASGRIREVASKSSEWKHREILKYPDVASYGDLVGEIILQKHLLREIEDVLRKYRLEMSGIGMENLGLTKSSDEGEYLPDLCSCAEISIRPLDEKDARNREHP